MNEITAAEIDVTPLGERLANALDYQPDFVSRIQLCKHAIRVAETAAWNAAIEAAAKALDKTCPMRSCQHCSASITAIRSLARPEQP